METVDALDELAKAAYGKLRLHRRRLASGLVQMMRDGDLDVFDALAAAPLVFEEEKRRVEAAEFERRRLTWLDAYQVADCHDDDEPDAVAQTRKSAH